MNDNSRRRDFEKKWQDRFAEFASLRDDDAGIAGWSSSGLETRFRFFTSLWRGAKAGALYLDAGCGAGTYSRWLADEGLSVIGVDYSHPALAKAKQREATRIAYCAADASRLPFPDNSVDGVLCFGVLQAVWDSEPFVLEMARVLKPGGELWIDALNVRGLRAIWDLTGRRMRGKPMHLRYESSRKLMMTLRNAGFGNLSRHWLPIMPGRLRQLQAVCESKAMQSALDAIPFFGALASHSFVVRGMLKEKRNTVSS
jgi:ubiquinone/menaquinone biosynthesis C-methylase UbiE